MSANQVTQEQIAATITTWTHLAKHTDWSAPKVGLALLAERDRLEAKVQRLTELRDALVESLESMGGIPMTDRLAAALDESRTVIVWQEEVIPAEIDAAWNEYATRYRDMLSDDPDGDLEIFSAGFRAGASRRAPSPQPATGAAGLPDFTDGETIRKATELGIQIGNGLLQTPTNAKEEQDARPQP